jgi:putative heme-binding domain-containing protein
MPKFTFTPEQVKDVAAFLRYTTQMTIDRRTYELATIATGDPKAGQAFFQGAGQCTRCHGVAPQQGPNEASNLAGIGNRYDFPTMQSQIAYPNLRSSPGYERSRQRAIVTQPDGTQVTGVVEFLDDFDVRVRDTAGARQTFSRKGPAAIQILDPLEFHEGMLYRLTDADLHNLAAYLGGLK